MAEVQVRVCDVCKSVTVPASTFTITRGDEVATVDLCDEHAQPILDCLAAASPQVGAKMGRTRTNENKAAKKAPARPTRARSRVQVVTLEDIEKLKKAGK